MVERLDVNQTVQLAAMAGSTDGTTRNVTAESQWRSFNTAITTVSGTGELRAVAPGKTAVQATHRGRIASAEVFVLSSGTYVLQGEVLEAGNLPVAGAKIEVIDGLHAGRAVQTPLNLNTYEIFGLSGDLRIRATKDGYFAEMKSITMTENRRLDFELRPTTPPTSLAGRYRLTFTASNACAGQLREDLRSRSYDAVLRQEGPRVSVALTGAQFVVGSDNRGSGFSGTVQGKAASFSLGLANSGFDTYYSSYFYSAYAWDVVERLPDAGWSPPQPGSTYLTVGGTATGTVTPSGLLGTLDGTLTEWRALEGFYELRTRTTTASCRAPDHQFVLTRQ